MVHELCLVTISISGKRVDACSPSNFQFLSRYWYRLFECALKILIHFPRIPSIVCGILWQWRFRAGWFPFGPGWSVSVHSYSSAILISNPVKMFRKMIGSCPSCRDEGSGFGFLTFHNDKNFLLSAVLNSEFWILNSEFGIVVRKQGTFCYLPEMLYVCMYH
jgi:hypothetical protein